MTCAPYHRTVADGPAGAAQWLTTADGVRLRAVHWPGPANRGTVVIFPGRTEFTEKYGRIAAAFVAAGFGVTALDWRGQGLSDRLIPNVRAGHIEDFAQYQQDARAYLDFVQQVAGDGPLHLLAHSMGGCIGLRTLLGQHPFQRAAFSAPMWDIALPPALRLITPVIIAGAAMLGLSRCFAPGTNGDSLFAKPFEGNLLTTDPESWAWAGQQVRQYPELSIGGPTIAWVAAARREMADLAKAPCPDLPALAILGSDEQIVSAEAIRRRMADWPGGQMLDLPGLRHETLIESPAQRGPILDRMVAHFGG